MKQHLFFLLVFICACAVSDCSEGQGIMTTLAGTGTDGHSGDGGPAILAELKSPSGVAVDKYGNVYVTDQNCSCVRKVDTVGIITGIVGDSGIAGYFGDGGQATAAELNWPEGLVVDDSGNLFIADQFNNAIRKVSGATGIITTIAGGGPTVIGYGGDGGPATDASLWHPNDVGVDHAGNVYFVDQDNHAMRKVNAATGIITTLAGLGPNLTGTGPDSLGGYDGDNKPGTDAALNFPQGIVVDSAGNVYIADFYNSRIRRVDAVTDTITTVAGNGTAGYSGDGGQATAAEIYDASAVAVDNNGNIYISDYYNSMIRKVSAATGIITTIAGNDTPAYCCDCHPATVAEIYYPQGVAVDKRGNVYIADYGNSRVRKVINPPFPAPISGDSIVCTDSTITLTDIDSSASYAWTSSDTGIATVGTGTGHVTGLAAGRTIITYMESGCPATIEVTVNNCLAEIKNIGNPTGDFLAVFPNPSQSSFTVNLSSASNEPIQIVVTNLLGITIKEIATTTNKETEIQLDAPPPGIYFITAVTGQGTQSGKVVIQH